MEVALLTIVALDVRVRNQELGMSVHVSIGHFVVQNNILYLRQSNMLGTSIYLLRISSQL